LIITIAFVFLFLKSKIIVCISHLCPFYFFYSTDIYFTYRAGKRKRAGTGKHCDYLDKREYGPVKRRRTDPVISLSIFLENGELKNF
jgi:hypothetical protein